ncbi:glycosyltransferase family 25 protein [Xenorhabdus bovienii]|uniref:glycosyltransferase family 25 protein n=1 Tax=Xenorhabdus bovienii TaxID=40576 RepID=UPI0023B28412|nr:glycosyltransferase family 25 protein [Xenorhabdus bovienii]MDE9545148.1 glycosyltransferase family 25 protein [Xenorhabdus bovienii]
MKIFIVNLKKHTQRKEKMQNQANKLGLHIEFIEAVYGPEINDEKLKRIAYDYPNCKLTKGEIGCSLSHLKIYKKIIDDNIEYALILEDDAVLSENITEYIKNIKNSDNIRKPNVYLLSEVISYIKNYNLHSNIYKSYHACGAHGYIINKKAAKKLLSKLQPIKYEADMWWIFRFRNYINVYCIIPHLIDTSDFDKKDSILEEERAKIIEEREKYRIALNKKEPFYPFYRIKEYFRKKYLFEIERIK